MHVLCTCLGDMRICTEHAQRVGRTLGETGAGPALHDSVAIFQARQI